MVRPQFLVIIVFIHLLQYVFCRPNFEPVDDKVVVGHKINNRDIPFLALVLSIKSGGPYDCGGSILSDEYILTAAHCVDRAEETHVRTGITNKNEAKDDASYILGESKIHPYYTKTPIDYDIAIIKLSRKLKLDGIQRQATKLVSIGTETPEGTNVTVAGWGKVSDNGDVSDESRATTLKILSPEKCRRNFSRLTSRMICAQDPLTGGNACNGDSGGPLVNTATNEQLGLVSYGIHGGCERYPIVYTNLADPDINQWIYYKMKHF